MATNIRLWWSNRELWMKKYDGTSYDYWKRFLKPALGRSVRRTTDAICLLGSRGRPPRHPAPSVRLALRLISRDMQKYQNISGAYITFDFLRSLALEHKRKILKKRAAN